MRHLVPIALVMALAGCGSSKTVALVDTQPVAAVATPTPPRFAQEKIEATKVALRAERKVVDLIYNPADAIEWEIAVKDDGSNRSGYAQYVCSVLKDQGVFDQTVSVRIVDAAKRAQFGDNYREYSLGGVRCSTGSQIS